MEKVVITRNFKGRTNAKYCVARYGEKPEKAREVDEIFVHDVQFTETFRDINITAFEDFGCGVVATGFAGLPEEKLENKTVLRFDGHAFEDLALRRYCTKAKKVLFGKDVIYAEETNALA